MIDQGHIDPEDFKALIEVKYPTTEEETQTARNMIQLVSREKTKAKQFAQLVDLRNANAKGIAFENRRRIIETFSPTGKATDSGYPEVQGEHDGLLNSESISC